MDGAREVAWAVGRIGCRVADVRDDFDGLVRDVEGAWKSAFPRRLGYLTRCRVVSEDEIRLTVSRGDFRGQVDLCCDLERDRKAAIRVVSAAQSLRLASARSHGELVATRSRWLATSMGAAMGLGFCWLATGAAATDQMPIVGGLMLSVIMASLVVGGGTLGGRIGEGLAQRRQIAIERQLQQDMGVQADIRRWNSLTRRLRGHRRALVRGLSGGPFRRASWPEPA